MRLPATRSFDLPERYPWLLRGAAASPAPAAWLVSFNRAGNPLKVEPEATAVSAPMLAYVKSARGDLGNLSRGVLAGTSGNARLSESGERLMRLLVWPE